MGKPTAIVKWKGYTHLQLTPTMQKNVRSGEVSHREIMSALPAKIYRKELFVAPELNRTKNVRNFVSIDAFNSPGGNITVSSTDDNICFTQSNGATIDMNIPNNQCERNVCVSSATSVVDNARRRVRSSGMMRPKFDESKSFNPIMYCTNTRQYLEQRNKTFTQNSFHHTRVGMPSLISTPDPTDQINRYSPGGLLHCPKLHIVSPPDPTGNNDGYMEYLWIDRIYSDETDNSSPAFRTPVTYQIYLKTGYYTVEDLNDTIHSSMVQHKHYFINKQNGSKSFLMNVIYNVYRNQIELQCLSSAQFPSSEYDIPNFVDGEDIPWTRPEPSFSTCPVLHVPDNNMSVNMGFSPGYYPNVLEWLREAPGFNVITPPAYPTNISDETCPNVRTTDYAVLSTSQFHIFPLYKSVNYNPNNNRFAQQGAVSASQRTLRQKYDQITSNGSSYMSPYNSATANALAYSTRTASYSEKEMLGYPNKKTTVFCPNSGEMKCVDIIRTKRNMP